MSMDLLEAHNVIREIKRNTMAPVINEKIKRIKICSKRKEALEIAARLIKREITRISEGQTLYKVRVKR